MKVTTETFYCDICKNEIEQPNENLNIPATTISLNYVKGGLLKYEHVCQNCTKKIHELITELIVK